MMNPSDENSPVPPEFGESIEDRTASLPALEPAPGDRGFAELPCLPRHPQFLSPVFPRISRLPGRGRISSFSFFSGLSVSFWCKALWPFTMRRMRAAPRTTGTISDVQATVPSGKHAHLVCDDFLFSLCNPVGIARTSLLAVPGLAENSVL